MKATKIFTVLFLTLSLGSCKKEENKPEEAEVTNIYTFTLNAVVKQDDDFQIFYKEDNNPETPYEELSSIWTGVKGVETAQDIVFVLPEDVIPTQLRFDFGQNKRQPEIVVNSFKVAFRDKSFSVSGKDFFKYFIPDENFVKVDAEASKVIPVSTGTTYDPMFFSTADFNTEMAKISQ